MSEFKGIKLPDGTTYTPLGGGSGGGFNPTLISELEADGESIAITKNVELTDGMYVAGFEIPEQTPDENKGQTIYMRIGDEGIFGQGMVLPLLTSNVSYDNCNSVSTFFIKEQKMYTIGGYYSKASIQRISFKKGGIPIVINKITMYSQTSKPVPVGIYGQLWKLF